MKTLEKASGVRDDSGIYKLSAKDSASLISSESSGQVAFGMAKVDVEIAGAYILGSICLWTQQCKVRRS